MTVIWDIERSGGMKFAQVCRYLEEMGDRLFSECLEETAAVLRALYEDRDFLQAFLLEQINSQSATDNLYSSQVFVLKKSKFFTLRAVIWDAPAGLLGEEMFLYEMPHDHDFSFFTLGYFGPGYETSVCSYDHDSVVGLPDEAIAPGCRDRWQLKKARVVLFEGGRDIHSQCAPTSFSISFNVLQDIGAFGIKRKQFEFDQDFTKVKKVLNGGPLPLLINAAASLGVGAEYVEEIALSAPSDHSRGAAWQALISIDERYVQQALCDESNYVKCLVRAKAASCHNHAVDSAT